MPDFDLSEIYGSVRRHLVELAPTLDAAQLATEVPACPGWTVQDTYAHLVGLAADAIAGQTGWLGSDDNTARQVAERRGRPIGDLCDEWSALGPAMEAFLVANNVTALAIDVWTHSQDIHNALDMAWGRDHPGLELTMSSVWRLKRRFREQGLAGIRIVTGDHNWLLADAEPEATLRIERYELARAVLGRRSRSQLLAYDWDGDPEPYATMLPVFNPPLRDLVE